jgi:hypothetical protein
MPDSSKIVETIQLNNKYNLEEGNIQINDQFIFIFLFFVKAHRQLDQALRQTFVEARNLKTLKIWINDDERSLKNEKS